MTGDFLIEQPMTWDFFNRTTHDMGLFLAQSTMIGVVFRRSTVTNGKLFLSHSQWGLQEADSI